MNTNQKTRVIKLEEKQTASSLDSLGALHKGAPFSLILAFIKRD